MKEYGFTILDTFYYGLSVQKRGTFLDNQYSQDLFSDLNQQKKCAGTELQDCYLNDKTIPLWLKELIIGSRGVAYRAAKMGDAEPYCQELMRVFYQINGFEETPFLKFMSAAIGGRAVAHRRDIISQQTNKFLFDGVSLLNLGSAFGDCIDVLLKSLNQPFNIEVLNIDIDQKAIDIGNQQFAKHNNVSFLKADMMKLQLKKKYNIVWLIGMLCGLNTKHTIHFTNTAAQYGENDGILIGACLTDKMVFKDLFGSWTMANILEWHLNYRKPANVKECFEAAELKWLGSFSEGHNKLYEIGIGKIKK